MSSHPDVIPNWISSEWRPARSGATFDKRSPHDGCRLAVVAASGEADVHEAIAAARAAQPAWAARTVVERGNLLRALAFKLQEQRQRFADIVALETGKSPRLAAGEADAAIEMALFIAGEGRRYYGRTMPASMANRTVLTVRQPLGVAALIISFNTPLPNIAWKVFPALLCGNGVVLKPSEDTPLSAWAFADLCRQAGLPDGLVNIVHGIGSEVGPPLVESPGIDLVSFTGSAETGRKIQEAAGRRLAKVCMELGGKNAFVVCDDADLENTVNWALASSFSNAGQRCAAASRIIVFESVYENFRGKFVKAARALKVGPGDDDYLGPVINERQVLKLSAAVKKAVSEGAVLLAGGNRLTDPAHAAGFYMAPTVLENVDPAAEISQMELFGPVTILYRVAGFEEALALANNSRYGLTSAIHTNSVHRAMKYAENVAAGMVVVNAGTFGSEPHMGFGGVKNSGTGWREAGVEALDVYSDWKYINIIHDPGKA